MVAVSVAHVDPITEAQLRLRPRPVTPRTWQEYLRISRWWELEAERGYASSADSRRYAENMLWAAREATNFGPGTWPELIARAEKRGEVFE